jgi:uncharacterized protein with von Willebrand factor type A (vWA) domain
MKKELVNKVSRLGLPLMEVCEDFDVNQALAEVVKSEELRLWEGFPVLLANAAKDFLFDYEKVLGCLSSKDERENLQNLVLMSFAIYKLYHLSFPWAEEFKKSFSKEELKKVNELKNCLAHNQELFLEKYRFDPFRLKQVFNNYFEQEVERTRKLNERHGEMSLEFALSQLFSSKQKELFKKKLEGLPLNKTEKEYYSRTVRKKLSALANPELHRLAQKLMDY